VAAPYRDGLEIVAPWALPDTPPPSTGLVDKSDGRVARLVIPAPFFWTGVFWAVLYFIAAVIVIAVVPLGRFVEALPVLLSALGFSAFMLLPFLRQRNAEVLEIRDGALWYRCVGGREVTALGALTDVAFAGTAPYLHIGRSGGRPLAVAYGCSEAAVVWAERWVSERVAAARAELDDHG